MNKNEFYHNEFSPGFFMTMDGSAIIAVYVDDVSFSWWALDAQRKSCEHRGYKPRRRGQ